MGTYSNLRKLKKPTPGSQDEPGSTTQSTDQSTTQPTAQSTEQSTTSQKGINTEIGPILDRSKGFYITAKVDKWLDKAVNYYRSQGLHKVDRSVVVNAILHKSEHFGESGLSDLKQGVIDHLMNKSVSQRI